MKELIKKYPNDQDLGKAIRKDYLENGDEAAELLKEVLVLHGNVYVNDRSDNEMMNAVDTKIIAFLKRRESNG